MKRTRKTSGENGGGGGGGGDTVTLTNLCGETVSMRCYEVAGKRVREYADGSMMIEVRPGRMRLFPAEHWMCRVIQEGGKLAAFRDRLRRNAPGTHEPVTYYIDNEGKIGVPPEPGMEPPDNVTVHQARTLGDIDRISATMERQTLEQFQDDGVATRAFDEIFEFRRDELVHAMGHGRGRKEREIAQLMLADLDREAADRQRISAHARFHWRDHDH